MPDVDVVLLENKSNTSISFNMSINDRPDGWSYADYVHWEAVDSIETPNQYSMWANIGERASLDTSLATWQLLDEISSETYSGLAEDEVRYMHLKFHAPTYSGDRYVHQLILTIEASIF
jgi:hypothetical protein